MTNSSLMTMVIVLTAVAMVKCVDNQDKLNYLIQLFNQQQSILQNIQAIADVDANLNFNLDMSNNQSYQKTVMQGAIETERELILKAYSNSFLPAAMKIWNCQNLSENQYQTIEKQINDLQIELQKSEAAITHQPYCERNEALKHHTLFLRTTINGIKKQLVRMCESVAVLFTSNGESSFLDTTQSYFLPNQQTQSPWIYGNITENQFQDKYKSLSILYGAVKCPLDAPFLNQTNQCDICPSDLVYDISIKKCKNCEEGHIYSKQSHSCITGILLLNSYLNESKNYVGSPPEFNINILNCPTDRPYFTNKFCMSCSLPLYFDFNQNNCISCGNTSIFDSVAKKCRDNLFYLSSVTNQSNFIGISLSAPPNSITKKCDQLIPFSNGTFCFSCILPKFFNFQIMSCQQCPQGLIFNTQSHSCLSLSGNTTFNNSNIINNRNFVGHVPLFNVLFGNCPEDLPFFNGQKCIACTLPSYFNFDSSSCETCPQKLYFNKVIQICEYINQNYYTNLQDANIYYNGNYDQVKQLINQKKQQNKSMMECPKDHPYYDNRVDLCISCTNDQPLFDFKRNKCIKCPEGSQFSGHICLTNQVNDKIQRMLMNS